ncbi:hypothetical protein [Ascidiimonas sp. W6]|uniref:hypothetical protein n=1 Tax=Ascidiimonas meishanensis TaxID=3128903 RepID=UPI0030EE9741
MDNELRNTTQDPARQRNVAYQRRVLRNNVLPGLVMGEMGNLPMMHMENLVRMMEREYERLNPEQRRILRRYIIAPTTVLVAAVGAINIFNNQKHQNDRTTANINSALWSVALVPLLALIAESVKDAINRSQEIPQRQDDETASLSMHSAPELDTLGGMEMGNLQELNNLAVLPESISNSSQQFPVNRPEPSILPPQRPKPARSRSFP